MNELMYFLIVLLTAVIIALIIKFIINKINYYPNETIEIDISRKNSMNNNDLLDFYIINYGTQRLDDHINKIKKWQSEKISSLKDCKKEKFIKKCKKLENKAFRFKGIRSQTRYKQINYQRYSYKVNTIVIDFSVGYEYVSNRINFLKKHDYNVTYNNFNKIDQRRALTKELRDKIILRDNYTCQICGKYMLDGVGLHVDHIIPVSKGGKSIPENLRVLCSKCNGKKGNKITKK